MVHWIQARQAFVNERRRVRFHTVAEVSYGSHGAWLRLDRTWLRRPRDEYDAHRRSQFFEEYWVVSDTERLAELLRRPDLTRRQGNPVVAANESRELLAFAVGPPELPSRVVFLGAFDLERGVLAAADDRQPGWWLLEGYPADPFHGSTDAKSWVAKWKAQVEAGETPSWD